MNCKKMRGKTYLSLANTKLNTVTRSSTPVLISTPLKLHERKKKKSRVFKATQFTHHLPVETVREQQGLRPTDGMGGKEGGGESKGGGERREKRMEEESVMRGR